MSNTYDFEFWAVDKHGQKYHEYLHLKNRSKSKAKKVIEEKYGFKISECLDFGIRRTFTY